jgi:hypothetical protein
MLAILNNPRFVLVLIVHFSTKVEMTSRSLKSKMDLCFSCFFSSALDISIAIQDIQMDICTLLNIT